MENWILYMIEEFGYIGVFLILVIENVFPPIPSELVLPFSGFVTTQTNLDTFTMILAATGGSIIGAVILYSIGTALNVDRIDYIVERWGKVLQLEKRHIERAEKWFEKYGPWTVFLCRMVPLLRSLISIPAGMSRMKWFLFVFLTSAGTFIWNSFLILSGVQLGEAWPQILKYMKIYSNGIYMAIGIVIVWVLVLYITKRHNKK
ncbi:DedA family protein [Sediminibacillus massiliensis]|uniref:DedA family protein n=1 Tax=Sediminibacillus massiliensis TaxID=1926277 RepID=UPI00098832D4|nr:DedA family protein [Sediminibacillus massiliensis]